MQLDYPSAFAVASRRWYRLHSQHHNTVRRGRVCSVDPLSLYNMLQLLIAALLLGGVTSDNSTGTADDECLGPWSQALEDWATAPHSERHGRIMVLAPAKGYYVTERIDTPLQPPPPPPPQPAPPAPPVPVMKASYKPHTPQGYSEWDGVGPGKIVNRPPQPYKDKFKPSYPAPPVPQYAGDRVDDPPKRVSETDLYLLTAIEKLVYRADLTEKRLRKIEEAVQLIMGGETKPEASCGAEFTRVGGGCYHWSREAVDWKDASRACRRRSASLLELPRREDAKAVITALISDKKLKGDDYWTGGLNPGLLWIWSGSARPIQTNTTDNATVSISGDGRCLALTHEAAVHTYIYRGQDCGIRHRYICQLEEKGKLSNEIEKTARALRHDNRRAKLLLDSLQERIVQ